VLILGDLGLLARDGQAADTWTAFCQRMTALGARPVAWVPASPQLVSRDAARHAQVHCLGAGDLRALKPGRCAAKPARPSAALCRLLTFIACCVRVEPALLRSLRLMSPDTAAEPGLEALVWSDPEEVRAGNRFAKSPDLPRPGIARPSVRWARRKLGVPSRTRFSCGCWRGMRIRGGRPNLWRC
jgi:hypothetical protein